MGCCSLDCFVYFVLSIALAFMAVSTSRFQHHKN
ncbi:BnaA03g60470D [Brassica napus]|uniref:BnaA03g60470D protein n=1 Tax=Brassica napus TaxID=3708 RepID=A0A078H5F5_BRANA|nr:BnaA03g60470D [Brassica napus]